jgi:hypothetical protein
MGGGGGATNGDPWALGRGLIARGAFAFSSLCPTSGSTAPRALAWIFVVIGRGLYSWFCGEGRGGKDVFSGGFSLSARFFCRGSCRFPGPTRAGATVCSGIGAGPFPPFPPLFRAGAGGGWAEGTDGLIHPGFSGLGLPRRPMVAPGGGLGPWGTDVSFFFFTSGGGLGGPGRSVGGAFGARGQGWPIASVKDTRPRDSFPEGGGWSTHPPPVLVPARGPGNSFRGLGPGPHRAVPGGPGMASKLGPRPPVGGVTVPRRDPPAKNPRRTTAWGPRLARTAGTWVGAGRGAGGGGGTFPAGLTGNPVAPSSPQKPRTGPAPGTIRFSPPRRRPGCRGPSRGWRGGSGR